MSTMNFSVPEDVKQAFNATFEGQNKSAVLTQMLRAAIEQAQVQRQREAAVASILELRKTAPERSTKQLAAARRVGRP